MAKRSLSSKRSAFRVVALYSIFGLLWIFLSDRALQLLAPNPDTYRLFQSYKGAVYVIVTAGLLYVLIRREVQLVTGLLRDREQLLKELDHRVRNNLQVALSLLSIEMRRDADVRRDGAGLLKERLSAVHRQLRTLSTAHNLADREEGSGGVPVGSYIDSVLTSLAGDTSWLGLGLDELDRHSVSVDEAIALGLLLTEVGADVIGHGAAGIRWSEDADNADNADNADGRSRLVLTFTLSSETSQVRGSTLFDLCVEELSGHVQVSEDGSSRLSVRLAVR